MGGKTESLLRNHELIRQGDLALHDYDRDRRKALRRVGYLLLVLLPLPVLLFRAHASPLAILSIALLPAFVLGVIVPVAYRRWYHPDRDLTAERRFIRLALVCRPLGFLLGVAALIGIAMDTPLANHTGMVTAVVGVIVFAIPQLIAKR